MPPWLTDSQGNDLLEPVNDQLPVGNEFEGPLREGYDWGFDYSGEWFGREDQHDIVGPSFDLDGDWVGWNSEEAQDDPTRPANWGAGVWLALAVGGTAAAAILLRPYAGLADSAID